MSGKESEPSGVAAAWSQAHIHGKMALILGTWFGSGCSPVAPGTFGTLAGIPVVLVLNTFSPMLQLLCLIFMTLVSIWAAQALEGLLKKPDPSEVVIDEVSGFFLTMLWIPISWHTILAGFLLFRLFDIWKPWPVRSAERLHGGLGIVLDDLLAGVYANLSLRGFLLLIAF